jgi:hypothetical protein
MAVYDRNMFRGSRPTARGTSPKAATQAVSSMANLSQSVAGPMIQEGIAGVMKDMTAGVKAAEDYRGAMNAFRGDDKSVEQRREELGGIVGMKDAKKTPESVLTLVQPVMEMREMGQVDQGIGQVAQKAMDTPVEGKMAQGIMQPVRMKPGGAVSLAELYKQNLPMIQDIYGDDTDELRKRATGQFLLGTAAPLGLAIAQGMPIEEALMRGLPELGKAGASVDAAKRKTRDAQRQAALNLATTQFAEQNKLTERDPTKDLYRGPTLVRKGVPKAQAFTPTSLYKVTDDGYESTYVTSLEQAQTAAGQGFTESSRPPGQEVGKPTFYFDKSIGGLRLYTDEEVDALPEDQRNNLGPVPSEPKFGKDIFIVDLDAPRGFRSMTIQPGDEVPEGYSFTKPDIKFGEYFDSVKKVVVSIPDAKARQNTTRYTKPGSDTIIDVYDRETGQQVKLPFNEYDNDRSKYSIDDPNATDTVYFSQATTVKVNGVDTVFPAGTPANFKKSTIAGFPEGSYTTTAPPAKKDEKYVSNLTPIEDIVLNGEILPAGQMIAKVPQAFYDKNPSKFLTSEDVAAQRADDKDAKKTTNMTFLEAGTYQLPTGNTITVEAGESRPLTPAAVDAINEQNPNAFGKKPDPVKPNMINVRFLQSVNKDGVVGARGQVKPVPADFVNNNMSLFEAVDQGTDKAPKLTEPQARTNLESIVPQIMTEGLPDAEFQTLRRSFENNLAALIDRSGTANISTTVEGGQVSLPPSIPSFVMDTLIELNQGLTFEEARAAGVKTAINDFGLLAKPTESATPTFADMISSELNLSESNLGASGVIKRGVDGVFVPLQNLFLGRATAAFPESRQAVKDVEGLNTYALIIYRNALPAQTKGSLVDEFQKTLPNITGITEANQQRAADAKKVATFLYNMKVKVETERDNLPATTRNEKERARLLSSLYELENLEEQYIRLSNMLGGNFAAAGDPGSTTSNTDNSMDSIFDPL